jgi:hypothetical protein
MKDWTLEEALAAQKAYTDAGGESNHATPLSQWLGLQTIEELQGQYEDGDEFALLHAVHECAMRELVMPDWVAQAYIDRLRQVTHFKVRTLDEAFGSYLPKSAKLSAHRQAREKGIIAYYEVKERHEAGESIGEALFEDVGQELALGASKVRDYYYQWHRRLSYKKPPE